MGGASWGWQEEGNECYRYIGFVWNGGVGLFLVCWWFEDLVVK